MVICVSNPSSTIGWARAARRQLRQCSTERCLPYLGVHSQRSPSSYRPAPGTGLALRAPSQRSGWQRKQTAISWGEHLLPEAQTSLSAPDAHAAPL